MTDAAFRSDPTSPLLGRAVLDGDAETLGRITAVYLDPATEHATWARVSAAARDAVVPLDSGAAGAGDVRLSLQRSTVEDAPLPDELSWIGTEDDRRLRLHYGTDDGTDYGTDYGTDGAIAEGVGAGFEDTWRGAGWNRLDGLPSDRVEDPFDDLDSS